MKRVVFLILVLVPWYGCTVNTRQGQVDHSAVNQVQTARDLLRQQTGTSARHEQVVAKLNGLVEQYYQDGDYRTALTIAQQAAHYAERNLGAEHADTLRSVNNLAFLYQAQGRYGEAEPLYERALAGYERALGPEHPDTLVSVNNLAVLYQAQGRHGEAEPLYERSLAVREKVLGPEHPDTLRSVNNLAVLYASQGRYGEAEPLLRHALAVREKALGPEHPDMLTSVNNLAALYASQDRYGEAEPLLRHALAVREKALGPEHPDTLNSLNNLAVLYWAQGRYGEAEPFYERALAGHEKVLGEEHPGTLSVQLDYAANQVNLGRIQQARRLLERLEPRLLELAALRLRHTRQERVRRQFLFRQSTFQDVVLTLALSHPKGGFVELAARVMLRWKWIQAEEEAFLARFVRARAGRDSAAVRRLANDIATLRRDLSRLANLPVVNEGEGKKPYRSLRDKLNALEAKEVQLAQLSREFKRHLEVRNANIADVRSGLPEGGALLELRRYRPVEFKSGESGEPRFAALLLTASGEMSLHDLGEVATTRRLWSGLRNNYTRDAAAKLFSQLFGKLDARLRQFDELYIAPDDFLNLIAFSRLVTPEGSYWVERDTILRQIQTGRHLISPYSGDLAMPKGLLAIGGVDYDAFGGVKGERQEAAPSGDLAALRAVTRTVSSAIGRFQALANTGPEVRAVAKRYWDYWGSEPRLWLGENATERRLKDLAAPPAVLHLATHGFFLARDEDDIVDRPMVLSGLALAGANEGLRGETGPDGEDGILYALEAQNLNLGDTKLVVLSACDTGGGKPGTLGALDHSEGVYGLVRAFRIAGARNVLMSLWSLGDADAREFMERFYNTWLDGTKPKDLAVALRETQRSFIEDSNEKLRDPDVWAPYVLVEGQW